MDLLRIGYECQLHERYLVEYALDAIKTQLVVEILLHSNFYVFYVEDVIAMLTILYVDDLIITESRSLLIDEVKVQLSDQFEMTDLGILHYYLGMEIWQSSSSIFISQMKYVKGLITKYKLEDCRVSSFSLLPHAKLSRHDNNPKFGSATKYRQLIGSL